MCGVNRTCSTVKMGTSCLRESEKGENKDLKENVWICEQRFDGWFVEGYSSVNVNYKPKDTHLQRHARAALCWRAQQFCLHGEILSEDYPWRFK